MLELSSEEASLVVAEVAAAADLLGEPRRQQALDVASAATGGAVPDHLLATLERILSASLQGGRARKLYKAEGEKLLTGVLLRTPGGQQLREGLDAVNQALRSLSGRRLDEVKVAMRTPGHFTVSLQAENVGLVLAVQPSGVAVESLTA